MDTPKKKFRSHRANVVWGAHADAYKWKIKIKHPIKKQFS